MTRKLVLLSLLCTVVALTACGGDGDKNKGTSGGTTTSADLKKINRVSAQAHGIEAKFGGAKTTGAATGFQPGDNVDGAVMEQFIVQQAKRKTGIDVKAQCPPSTKFSPGAVFYCKITLPDGTTIDVKCTMVSDGNVYIEFVTSNPTPQPPQNATTSKLEGAKGRAELAKGAPRKVGVPLNLETLEDEIEQTLEQQYSVDVNVECFFPVEYQDGAEFYCKAYTPDGTGYDVRCTIQGDNITWKLVI